VSEDRPPAALGTVRFRGMGTRKAGGIDEVMQVTVVPRVGESVVRGPEKRGRVNDVWHDYKAGEVQVIIE
jgi:hypothetical protein